MTSQFLLGIFAAWAVTHLGLALFFALVYTVGRREREYLLFSLLCATFSILTLGTVLDLSDSALWLRRVADEMAHAAGIGAAALNLHFALRLSFSGSRYRFLPVVYGLAALLSVAACTGALWNADSYHLDSSQAFQQRMVHGQGDPSWIGWVFYGVGTAEVLIAIAVLSVAYSRGRRDILTVLLTSLCVGGATVNDVLVMVGVTRGSLFLLPHAFVIYAVGAAGTLLWRYRVSAGELEHTASSLRQRTEELRRSYAELAQLQGELIIKKQLAAVGELAAAIAHEVRNPLAVIVNAVAGLRRTGIADDDRTMLLGIVEEEAGRLNRLVTDLLRFARPVSVKRSPVSLVELANRCRSNASNTSEIRVAVADDPAVQTVDVDPNLFRLVLDNLVANASQAMGGSGIVDIRIDRGTLRGEDAARIVVGDTGHGMEAVVLKRALDPFFTTRPSGTGLGLPIVQRIIEAHGGELHLDSSEGEGTRVTVLVPLPVPEAVSA